jgi:hypothetical protein
VFIADRFGNGTARSNALAQLKRAGVDIVGYIESKHTKEESTVSEVNGVAPPALTHRPPIPTPQVADPPRQPVPSRPSPQAQPTPTKISTPVPGITELKEQLDDIQSQINDLLGMMVSAENAVNAADGRTLRVAGEVTDTLKNFAERLVKLETADQTRLTAIGRLQTQRSQADARILKLEHTVRDLPAGDTPRVDPVAVLDEAILKFMDATPLKLTSAVIAANLPVELAANSNQVGKRLQALVNAGEVEVVDHLGVSKVYIRATQPDNKES